MVFENIAAFFVDKFLGNYIEDIDSHQLKIHLWNGDITLQNVHLKTNALNDMNVPVEILTGYLEQLKVHIPWKHLYAQTTKIEIDGLYLLVTAKTDINYSIEKAEEDEYESKMNEVNKVEHFRHQRELYEINKSNPHHKDTFFQRLQFHILTNLEIDIRNIHIAFDDKTIKSYPFQFGIHLQHFQLIITDQQQQQQQNENNLIYKFAEISNLAFYWNSNVKSRLDLSKEEILEDLQSRKLNEYPKMNLIIEPLNAKAQLKIAKMSQEQDFQRPVLDAEVNFDEIYLNVNKNQYADLLDFLEHQDYLNNKKKFIKYYQIFQQDQTDKNARTRWRFACQIVLNEFVRPRLASFKWETIKENVRRYKEYQQIYLDQLNHKHVKQHQQRAKELEKQIDLFNLIYIRRLADIQFKRQKLEEEHLSWWDKFNNWWKSNSNENNQENVPLTNEEKLQFYEAIGYKDDKVSDQVYYPQQYVDLNVELKLNLIEANVWSMIQPNDSQLKVISRASICQSQLDYQRRPAKDDLALKLEIDSFELAGIDSEKSELNLSRPILIEPFEKKENKEKKLISIEFESNPLNTKQDYRLSCLTESLLINYHANTINQLIQCFLPDRHHDLEGIKRAAYSIYTDIKHRTQFLVSENLKKIQDLDVNVDLQSIYFLLPQNGQLTESSSKLCLDLGRLTFKGGETNIEKADDIFHDAKSNLDDDENLSASVPLQIQLENLQILLVENENWFDLTLKQDSLAHLIKPITITIDIFKSLVIDNPQIPIWKVSGESNSIECPLSDTRIFSLIQLINSIPLPMQNQPTTTTTNQKKIEEENYLKSVKDHYETIENLTSVKKILREQEENDAQQIDSQLKQQQLIQIKACFQIPKITILLKRSLIDFTDVTEDFLSLTLNEFVVCSQIETFDIKMNSYLKDFDVKHEQFQINNLEKFRLITKKKSGNLFEINALLTSTANPKFTEGPYHKIENHLSLKVNHLQIHFQFEVISSIIQFINQFRSNLFLLSTTNSLSSSLPSSSQSQVVESSSPSFQIRFQFDGIDLLLSSIDNYFLYFQLDLLKGFVSKNNSLILLNLIVKNLSLIDLNSNSFYREILSKEDPSKDLLQLDLSLFNYSNKLIEKPSDAQSYLKGYLQQIRFICLYKYIDLFVTIANSFQSSSPSPPSQPLSNDQPSTLSSLIDKYQENSYEFQMDLTLKGPLIEIPLNSFSRECLNIDLGQLIFLSDKTNSNCQEKHSIRFENVSIFNILQCSPFVISIQRYFNSNQQNRIQIAIQWDSIDFQLSKYDFQTIQTILNENLQEKLIFKFPKIQSFDQQSPTTTTTTTTTTISQPIRTKQKSSLSTEIQLDFLIKQIGFTLFIEENDEISRDDNCKFVYLAIETIQAKLKLYQNSTFEANLIIQNFIGNDLKQIDPFHQFINKGFQVQQNSPFLILKLNQSNSNQTFLHGQIESFTISINTDFINSINRLLNTNQRNTQQNQLKQSTPIDISLPPTSTYISKYKPQPLQPIPEQQKQIQSNENENENAHQLKLDLTVKASQLILVENTKNNDSNCLVFNIDLLVNLIQINSQTKIAARIKHLNFYGANFQDFEQSKIRYSIVDPTEINAIILLKTNQQRIDLQLGDLSVNIDPILIRTFATLASAIQKQQKMPSNEAKDQLNVKDIFQPKPFQDGTFWFIQDFTPKDEIIEETDILQVATGLPSEKQKQIERNQKQKQIQQNCNLKQQLIVNLKMIEVKIELGNGLSTRPVVAICLSQIFADIQNWSTDFLIGSSLQIELALFNDHLLAWEPLIEPIINQKGIVQSPFTINCQTIIDEQQDDDDDNQQCLQLLDEDYSPSDDKQVNQSFRTNSDTKKLILIRAQHLLNVTLTKTTLDLIQRLQKMFNDVYEKGLQSDEDQQQAMLTINNQTGFDLSIHHILDLQFTDGNNNPDRSQDLKPNDLLRLTIPEERLRATHLPAIAEQISKRKQTFQLEIENKSLTIDINQTWRRVYDLFPSQNPSWPIQLLSHSQISQERRVVLLSSIIKLSNRTLFPLVILDPQSIENKQIQILHRIDVNQEYSLPIQYIYFRSTTKLYFSFLQNENLQLEPTDFLSFDWSNESIADRIYQLNSNKQAHFVIYKQENEAYSENTDEPIRKTFDIYVKLALHILNLLPITVQCSIDDNENSFIEPSQLYHSLQGHKKSLLTFTIPSYNNSKWLSQPIDLTKKGQGIHNEHILEFEDEITNEKLRMILRVDTYRGSFRASIYSPIWLRNSTDLKFQFKIDNEKTFIDVQQQTYLICPSKFNSQSQKNKGQIRLFCLEEDEQVSRWSQSFSIDVIQSTGITSCQVNNDRTYLVSIHIATSSFGMTKIITLLPSTVIINNSTINIEINENLSQQDETYWKLVEVNQIIPYWPRYLSEGILYVRYQRNPSTTTCFSVKDKHESLLRINDSERPALHVEVSANDFDGYQVNFNDYQIVDAPLLILNALDQSTISFAQKDDSLKRTQLLPSKYFQYYTWIDQLKSKELIVSIDEYSTQLDLNPSCGIIGKQQDNQIYYAIFRDGLQTVIIFTNHTQIIEAISDIPSTDESMQNYIQISFHSIGLSIINDIKCDDLFYITINPSREIWTFTNQFDIKPLGIKLNQHLEDNYSKYFKQFQSNQSKENKFNLDKHRFVSFDGDIGEITNENGDTIYVRRQSLDGFWLGFKSSLTNQALHLKINHIQIDNQLAITLFPTILYPIVSKAAATDIPGKPFIELSVLKSESIHSNTVQIKYLKLLIQEFVVCADQGLILAILSFVEQEKNPAAPTIDMTTDFDRLKNPLERYGKGQTDNQSVQTKIYFDNLHLSPLKIHVSFSMHGAKASEQLLAEYPIVDFILQILNVAEVQDVILKLNFYERKKDRFTMEKLSQEIGQHYLNQFLKQIHVVVLGLDVLGNPFGVVRGVAQGVESFFYEPYKGAMEGPVEFLEGIATGTKYLVGSVVGGAAGALSKVTQATSKGLATLTLDHHYQNARIQRKEIQSQTTPEIVASGKNAVKDIVQGVKGVVNKPVKGAKHSGAKGFVKGLGKGFLGLVGRPASGIVDLTSTSFKLIKKVATDEQIVHRIRNPRHIGRDGLVRPSIAHETLGNYIFDQFDQDQHTEHEGYIAHIDSSNQPHSLLFATTKRVVFLIGDQATPNQYKIEWDINYKDIKGLPTVKFDPNFIEFAIKETNAIGITKKDSLHVKVVPYQSIGEARYIVDQINATTAALEL